MNANRRRAAALVTALAMSALVPSLAQGQGKALKILVGYPPGGAVDVVARQVGEELRQQGYNAIIENKTGASGRLATEQLLQSPADGSTVLLMPNGNLSIFAHVYPRLKYSLGDLAAKIGQDGLLQLAPRYTVYPIEHRHHGLRRQLAHIGP